MSFDSSAAARPSTGSAALVNIYLSCDTPYKQRILKGSVLSVKYFSDLPLPKGVIGRIVCAVVFILGA
jgi:hypothetical protein